MESFDLRLEDKDTVIYKAWERLDATLTNPTDEIEQVLAKLEADLLAFEKQQRIDTKSRRISAERVMMFLQEEGEKGGKRFIGDNEAGISLRPSWKVFRNAFAAWFFDLEQSVVQDYLEKAAKENVSSDDVYQYSWTLPRSILSSVFHYLLSHQLVMARQPIIISETSIGFNGLSGAIEKVMSETEKEDEGN